MSAFNQVLWTLDNTIEPRQFEFLCVDLLGREGYKNIVPVGGTKDHGRDAEIRVWTGVSHSAHVTLFQFSLEDRWEEKLRRDAAKVSAYGHSVSRYVFVTSQAVTGLSQDKLRAEFQQRYGWELTIYCRDWFRHRLEEFDQDLAKKYLGIDLPETPPGLEARLSSCGSGGALPKEVFGETSPELVRGRLHQSASRDPANAETWKNLAKVDYHLRDYDAALHSVNRALDLKPKDLGLRLLKAAILGDGGIERHRRAWVVEAKEIFGVAVQKLGRFDDHYNLGNVLAPLGELDEAEKHYRICLQKQPDFAPAWKNLATVLFGQHRHDEEMRCYEKALLLNPRLVEAHVCRAITLLRIFNDPHGAIKSFDTAYAVDPDLDQKWRYVRYWFSKAWAGCGEIRKALDVIEISYRSNPGDLYVSDQKGIVLRRLWRVDRVFQPAALDFFQHRARTIPNDYAGLIELIDLCAVQGVPQKAWQFLAASLGTAPYSLELLVNRARITLQDFHAGFQAAGAYMRFRSFQKLEDHLVTLHQNGLSPNPNVSTALNQVLMAPFGVVYQSLEATPPEKRATQVPVIFERLLSQIGRIMSAFGASWLAKSKPQTHSKVVDLLSRAMVLLPEVVAAEAGRHIGFVLGVLGVTGDGCEQVGIRNSREFYADVAVQLLASVHDDWRLGGGDAR